MHAHDLFQAPDFPTDLFTLNKASGKTLAGRARRTAIAGARVRPAIARQSQHFAWRRLSRLSRCFRCGGAAQVWSRLVSAEFDRTEIQGNILRGYRRNDVRHLILEVGDRAAARKFFGVSVAGGDADVPGITSEAPWGDKKPPVCFNIGLTYGGLRALGTPAESLATFPTEFIEGMTSRALKLGDFGPSGPKHWPDPFDKPARVHMIASIYADDKEHLNSVQTQVAARLHRARLAGRAQSRRRQSVLRLQGQYLPASFR